MNDRFLSFSINLIHFEHRIMKHILIILKKRKLVSQYENLTDIFNFTLYIRNCIKVEIRVKTRNRVI